MQNKVKQKSMGKSSKQKAKEKLKRKPKDGRGGDKDVAREETKIDREINPAESLAKKASREEFCSPPSNLRRTGSSEELGFLEQSWTPSPSPKQMTLAAALERSGQKFEHVVVTSPGAKKQESLKDVLMKKV